MTYIMRAFGLDELRATHLVGFIFRFIETRQKEGESDLRKIKAELLKSESAGGKSV